ncbi:MAG: DUF4166 domain-containing protein [Pseudomonadota bacterium]
MLGDAFERLPPALQRFHAGTATATYSGTVTVRHGNWLARLMCRLGGFPPTSVDRPMRMSITVSPDGEHWHRDFDGHVLASLVRQTGATQVSEKFGLFDVTMSPQVSETGLDMPVTQIRVLGIPVPKMLLDTSGGAERVTSDGQVSFNVTSRMWGLGLIISYAGTLAADGPR